MRFAQLFAAVFLTLGLMCHSVHAQDPKPSVPKAVKPKGYQQMKVDDSQWKKRRNIQAILREGRFESGQQDAFDAFYGGYELPRWTQPSNRRILPDCRKKIRNAFAMAKRGEVYDRLNTLSLDVLGKIAGGNYHPVARVNAVLMINDLNVAQPGLNRQAVPLPAALPVLLKILEDESQIDATKAVALLGIARHAKAKIRDVPMQEQAVKELLKIATAESVKHRSAEGHTWMRTRAIQALAPFASQRDVAKTYVMIVADTGAPLDLRCEAAKLLGETNVTKQAGAPTSELVEWLSRLALTVCRSEIVAAKKRADDYAKARGGGRRGRGNFGMMEGGGYGRRTTDMDFVHRRKLIVQLRDVQTGLASVSKTTTRGDDKKLAQTISTSLKKWLSLLADKDLEDNELIDSLDMSVTGLAKLLPERKKE